jgi:hypothetical protein
LESKSIRSIPNITGNAAAGFKDESLWDEAKKKSDDAIKSMIDKALVGTNVTVVFIGAKTAGRKFINYEIEQSLKRGNGLVDMQIHHLKNHVGETDVDRDIPKAIEAGGFKVYNYADVEKLANRIEEAVKLAGK